MWMLTTLPAIAGATEWTPEAGVTDRGASVVTAALPATVSVPVLQAVLANESPKPLVVNVWASWCAPCVRELPTFEALSASGRANVILVNVDEANARSTAARLTAASAPTVRQLHLRPDDAPVVFTPWAGTLPTTWVIAPKGEVRARFSGTVTAEALVAALQGG